MGSTNFLNKSRTKSGSSIGSDKEMNGKLRRAKIRRPTKMNEYGLKRIPDYTELAYKEAVGKLRYFLSGNYAPSVRSYGGSASIKNLDESDIDLDKKLSSAYQPLGEYKPRPRLTAKYATLYADSLANQPAMYNVSTPPAPAVHTTSDLSGGTNPDVVNFIQKQEEYIEQLERESQYCRDELNNLLGKVKEVISENEHLHDAQKNKLISRMFHSYQAGSETDEPDDVGDSTGLDSDAKVTPSKGRKVKSRSSKLEGPNIVFESRIAELEAQLAQAKIDLKKIQDENNENKRKLASGLVDSTCLDGFKRQIDNLQRDKSALEAQVSKLKLNLDQKDDGVYKRSEIEQQLREERNNLETELRRLKDDLAKERSKVRELAGEGNRRAIQERSAAEQRYNAHFDDLQHDLAAQYDNVSKLQLDLERQRREENDLKRELSMKNSAVEELKMELKNKTSTLQADLAQAYAEKASFEEELASARLSIERNQRQAKHETNRLNSEIQSLRQRLDRADADLVHSRRENLRLTEQISALEKEINMKNLTPISPEKNKKEKELSSMLETMDNKHAKTVAGLESMIHSQNSLMEKLTGECRILTEKLDDANRRHNAQSRGRSDEPMRTQRDLSRSQEQSQKRSSKRRSERESDSSSNYSPIIVGPLTTNQELCNGKGEKVFNLPLMIQQPFLREKKEPIKVDISVKLIPKPKKRDKKKREAHIDEITIQAEENKGIKNSISMEITNGDINILKETVEVINEEDNNGKKDDSKQKDDVITEIKENNQGLAEMPEVENIVIVPVVENVAVVQDALVENETPVDYESREENENNEQLIEEQKVEVITTQINVEPNIEQEQKNPDDTKEEIIT